MRFDRTVSVAGTHNEVKRKQQAMVRELSVWQRLCAMWELSCRMYRIEPKDPPPFDRTAFSMRKFQDESSVTVAEKMDAASQTNTRKKQV